MALTELLRVSCRFDKFAAFGIVLGMTCMVRHLTDDTATKEMACRWIRQGCIISLVPSV